MKGRTARRRDGAARGRTTPRARLRKSAGPRRGGLFRRLGRIFAIFALLSVSGAAALFFWSVSPGAVTGPNSETVHIDVVVSEKGVVIEDLARRDLLSSPFLTKLYAYALAPTAAFEPRAHLISRGISARELVQRLAELGSRPKRKVTFPEGWTHLKMGERLEEAGICSAIGFGQAVFDPVLLTEFKLARTAEGYLFPASYEFFVDSDPRQVVRRMVTESWKRFSELKQAHPAHPDLKRANLSDQQIVILASIVEKETSRVSEAPRVARVFLNRLLHPEAETRGRLQSDPTAIYGCLIDPSAAPSCSRLGKAVTPEMLSDPRNIYNTYRHDGLPPGPISNPGERALRAVLQPAEGRELYFVADGTGTHTFSESYPEHLLAVEALRARKKERKIE